MYHSAYAKYSHRENCAYCRRHKVSTPGVASTAEAILEHFRSFMRQAALWQEPGILGVDVTMSQAKCLFVASLHPGISMSALASQLHVGLPAASGLVDRLVEHGYLMRQEDPTDRRQQLVTPTQTGHDVIDRFRRFSTDRMGDLLQGLSAAELDALLVGLAALERQARMHQPGDTAAAHERTPA
jgi:DNA-binding MarR family transcriptional regulator